MPNAGWFVNGDQTTIAQAIYRMRGHTRRYLRDMGTVLEAEDVFRGIDVNAYSIPQLKEMVLDEIHRTGKVGPDTLGKLPIMCKDGKVRNYNPESWAETIARTRSRGLQEEGLHNELTSAGIDLVVVSKGGSGDPCKAWEGKILSISGKTEGYQTVAQAQQIHLFHPRCVHNTSPVFVTEEKDTGKQVIWGRDWSMDELLKRAMPVEPAEAAEITAMARAVGGLKDKIAWVDENFVKTGKSKAEAIRALQQQYPDIKPNYAKTIVYSYMKDYGWGGKKAVREVVEEVVKKEVAEKTVTGSDNIAELVKKYQARASVTYKQMDTVGDAIVKEAIERARLGSTDLKRLYPQQMNELSDKIREIMSENRKFGLGGNLSAFRANPNLSWAAFARGTEEGLKKSFIQAAKQFPADWWDKWFSFKRHKIKLYSTQRGYYRPKQGAVIRAEIALSGRSTASQLQTAVHELGHAFEAFNKKVENMARKFLGDRTKGETAKWMGYPYDKSEMTKRDKFIDTYMGKQYPSFTEISSMGFEILLTPYHGDFMKLLNGDRQYFNMLVGMLLCL